MNFFSNIDIKPLPKPISYEHKIMLMGSCFTEHIGNNLHDLKFNVLQNPNGILFEPESVSKSLKIYTKPKLYTEHDLFYFNELWHSWDHHSRFSSPDIEKTLQNINSSQNQAHEFLKDTDWLIITLGSSFTYLLTDNSLSTPYYDRFESEGGRYVANCHKVPGGKFQKHLLSIYEIMSALDNCCHQLWNFNPKLKIIFTISPVRHLRDGVVDNNRSKARLIETVHHLVNKFDRLFYFPAYELVIDVLRDYRFYDIDLAHPNYAATQFVMEHFSDFAFDESTQNLMKEIKQLVTARNHKAFHPGSNQHQQFLKQHYAKAEALANAYPMLDFTAELEYFKIN